MTLLCGLSEDSMESLDSLLRRAVLAGAAEGSLGEDHLTRFLAVGATLLVRLSPFLVSSAMLRRLSGFVLVLPACQMVLFVTGGLALACHMEYC